MTAQVYCLKRSWRLRLRRRDSERLIILAVHYIQLDINHDKQRRFIFFSGDKEDMAYTLRVYLHRRVLEEHGGLRVYGNPILVWFLLNVIVPVVARLVIEWWLNRGELQS